MFYHIILTGECNLHCKYCGGSFNPNDVPFKLQYSIEDLKKFLMQDPDRSIAFYGGEPLLNIPSMLEIMDHIPATYYSIQTNGVLIKQIPKKYLKKFHTILVSIDGRPEITDYYRQIDERSIYQTVVDNSRWLRENGFKGDLIARMAVSHRSDIYKEVTHLLNLKDQFDNILFNHIHWQLDVLWGTEGILWSDTKSIKKINWDFFDKWVKEKYNPGVSKLSKAWVLGMRDGKILGIVPFLNVMQDLLNGNLSNIRCGSGYEFFAINPHGFITSCPIAYTDDFRVGDIWNNSPESIFNSMPLTEPCLSCDVKNICGGRCLYANKTRFWGDDGYNRVCETVKYFIDVLKRVKPEIEDLISKKIISAQDFAYPAFNNGCEIIP